MTCRAVIPFDGSGEEIVGVSCQTWFSDQCQALLDETLIPPDQAIGGQVVALRGGYQANGQCSLVGTVLPISEIVLCLRPGVFYPRSSTLISAERDRAMLTQAASGIHEDIFAARLPELIYRGARFPGKRVIEFLVFAELILVMEHRSLPDAGRRAMAGEDAPDKHLYCIHAPIPNRHAQIHLARTIPGAIEVARQYGF